MFLPEQELLFYLLCRTITAQMRFLGIILNCFATRNITELPYGDHARCVEHLFFVCCMTRVSSLGAFIFLLSCLPLFPDTKATNY